MNTKKTFGIIGGVGVIATILGLLGLSKQAAQNTDNECYELPPTNYEEGTDVNEEEGETTED